MRNRIHAFLHKLDCLFWVDEHISNLPMESAEGFGNEQD